MRAPILLVSLVTCLAGPGFAHAEELDGGVHSESWGTERVLGDHVFEYPILTQTAFVSSTLNFQVLTAFNSSRTASADEATTVSVQQIAPALNLEMNLRIADPVAITFGMVGAAATGISTSSLVLKGESLAYELNGGVIVRLLRDESSATQVSAYAGVLYASGSAINLRSLVTILQGDSGITIGDLLNTSLGEILLTPYNTFQGNVGGALAHAFSRVVSLQTSLTFTFAGINSNPYSIPDQMREALSQFVFTPSVAVALTLDGNAWRIPLALLAEYRLGMSATTANSSTTVTWGNSFDLGLFYSGRSDFQPGLAFLGFLGVPPLGVLSPTSGDHTQNGYGAVITMRYIW